MGTFSSLDSFRSIRAAIEQVWELQDKLESLVKPPVVQFGSCRTSWSGKHSLSFTPKACRAWSKAHIYRFVENAVSRWGCPDLPSRRVRQRSRHSRTARDFRPYLEVRSGVDKLECFSWPSPEWGCLA